MKLTFGQLKNDRCQLISQDQNWLKSCSLCPTGENEVTWSSMLLAHSFVTLVFCVTVKKKKSLRCGRVDFLEGCDQCGAFLLESGGGKNRETFEETKLWLVKGHVSRSIAEKSEILFIFQ